MNVLSQLLDLIYPPKCHVCESFLWKNRVVIKKEAIPVGPAFHLCQTCYDALPILSSSHCPVCGRSFPSQGQDEHLCEACIRKRPFFEALGSPYLYEGNLMTAIHQFKYGGRNYLSRTLGTLMAFFAIGWLEKRDDFLIMPVPLHPKRLRERGFNQSLLLAREISSLAGWQLDYLSLKRVKDTTPQTNLSSIDRRRNVRRAFEIMEKDLVKGRILVLVDDVATTGSTLNECARVLKRAGARKVFCLVLARTQSY